MRNFEIYIGHVIYYKKCIKERDEEREIDRDTATTEKCA